MVKSAPQQVSFNGGQWSPLLYARSDLQKYQNALAECRNFIPTIQGPLIRRSGTRFVNEVKNSANFTRLLEFEFNADQAFVIEMGAIYFRFYKDRGVILNGASPYEAPSPFQQATLSQVFYDQSNDVMTLCDGLRRPQYLSRIADTNWNVDDVPFNPPPFGDINPVSGITLTWSGIEAAITVTASAALFTEDDVGTFWKVEENSESRFDEWKTATAYTTNNRVQYEGRVYKANISATSGNRAPVHTRGVQKDGATGVDWEYLHSGSGYFEIEAFNSSTSVNARVRSGRIPDNFSGGSADWYPPLWSENRGYPVCSSYHQGRHYFATRQRLDGSTVNDYNNFAPENRAGVVVDDGAVSFSLDSNKANIIRWLSPSEKGLVIGTSGAEWVLRANTLGEAITPTNVKAEQTTDNGVAVVRPIQVDQATLFVQRAQRKIMEFVYSFSEDGFLAPDMTELAENITNSIDGGIIDIAFQRQPNRVLWAVRADGTLLGFTYNRQQDVLAWHKHVIGGWSDAAKTIRAKVESIAVIPSPDGSKQDLWMIVKRYINGGVKRYVEYLEETYDATLQDREDIYFVDSGLTYNGAAATTISGLDHLEGETVQVVADGSIEPDQTVSGGSITLETAASVVHVGYGYTSRATTLSFQSGSTDGTAQGKTKRIHQVTFDFKDTLGGFYGPDPNNMVQLPSKQGVPMDSVAPLETGLKTVKWPNTYAATAQVVLEQRQALPMTVRAILPLMRTYDP